MGRDGTGWDGMGYGICDVGFAMWDDGMGWMRRDDTEVGYCGLSFRENATLLKSLAK